MRGCDTEHEKKLPPQMQAGHSRNTNLALPRGHQVPLLPDTGPHEWTGLQEASCHSRVSLPQVGLKYYVVFILKSTHFKGGPNLSSPKIEPLVLV